jgi:hypothetical protein
VITLVEGAWKAQLKDASGKVIYRSRWKARPDERAALVGLGIPALVRTAAGSRHPSL